MPSRPNLPQPEILFQVEHRIGIVPQFVKKMPSRPRLEQLEKTFGASSTFISNEPWHQYCPSRCIPAGSERRMYLRTHGRNM